MNYREKLKENTRIMIDKFPLEIIRELTSKMRGLGFEESEEQFDKIVKKFSKRRNPLLVGDIDKAIEEVKNVIDTGEFPETFSDDFFGCSTYLRDYLIPCWGYALLTDTFINSLRDFIGDKKCLEVMAGKGLLSALLKDKGINVIATDDNAWNGSTEEYSYTNIEIIEAEEAVRKYGNDIDYIIMSWPPLYEDSAYRVLKSMREINSSIRLIYIGEINGATADKNFFKIAKGDDNKDFLKVYKSYEPYSFLRDRPYLIK